jgi:hypothetical protein
MLNDQTAKYMGQPKTIVTSNLDEWNVQVTIWQTSVTVRKDLVMTDVSYVVETIPQITKGSLSTKSYMTKHNHNERNNKILPQKPNVP